MSKIYEMYQEEREEAQDFNVQENIFFSQKENKKLDKLVEEMFDDDSFRTIETDRDERISQQYEFQREQGR